MGSLGVACFSDLMSDNLNSFKGLYMGLYYNIADNYRG